MDRQKLINGVAAGALFAAGAGAIAWTQLGLEQAGSEAQDRALQQISDAASRPARVPIEACQHIVPMVAESLDGSATVASPLLPVSGTETVNGTGGQSEILHAHAEIAVDDAITERPLNGIIDPLVVPVEGTDDVLRLPTLPSVSLSTPYHVEANSYRARPSSNPAPTGFSNYRANHTNPTPVPALPPADAVSSNTLRLPTLKIAQQGRPAPVPPVAEGPVFTLTPVPTGSPLTGPRGQWDDVLVSDGGEPGQAQVLPPPPVPEFSSPEPVVVPEANELVDPPPAIDASPAYPPTLGEQLNESGPSWSGSMPPEVMPEGPGGPPGPAIHGPVISGPVGFGDKMLSPFESRFNRFFDDSLDELDGMPVIPRDSLRTWWAKSITDQLRPSKPSLPVDLGTLTLRALQFSPDVLAFQLSPEIERKTICEEKAAFDWTAFAETTYDDVSDPVGNTLTVGGGGDRLIDTNIIGSTGVRRRNLLGGEFELSQRFGYQDSNSQFFVPVRQGTSRMTLSYTQPLLSQHGKAYQQSRTVLAQLETGATEDETADRIQDHLLRVAEAYWDLFRSRAIYLQRRNLLDEATRILATLEGRSGMDTVPRQLLRARSAVLLRRSEITRAAMDIRNAESRLRLLVGDPQMTSGMPLELLPMEPPSTYHLPIHPADAARTAMAHRPDIREAVKRVRATGVRAGVAENELLPRLDFVFNGYVSGLEGEGRIMRSFGDQFSEGRPSFAAGLLFEIPLGNRAAKARHQRRQLEMVQATHELEAVVEGGLTEVEMAVREAETSYREMLNRFDSMQATGEEMDYLQDRWNLMPGGFSTTQLLEDLLDAQERLADDEAAFVTAQVNYVLAQAGLRRAMGTLMEIHPAGCPPTPLAHDVVPPSPTMASEGTSNSEQSDSPIPGLNLAKPVDPSSTAFDARSTGANQ